MWLVPTLQSFNPPPLVEDHVTEHALLPDITTRYISPEGEFDNIIVINALGFHDRPRVRRKAAGTYRIAVMGDSFVEGLHVPRHATLTAILEQTLAAERRGGRTIEVLNAGISGMSPLLEYLGLRDRILSFEPDLVVLCFFMNDVSEDQAFRPLVRLDDAGRPVRIIATTSRTAFVPMPLKIFVKQHSRFAVFMTNLHHFRGLRPRRIFSEGTLAWTPGEPPGDIFAAVRDPATPAAETAWAFTLSLLDHTATLLRERRVRFALVVIPTPNQVNDREWINGRRVWRLDGPPSTRPQQRLLAWGRTRGVPVLDLVPELRLGPEFPLFFPYDGHFTAAGHRATADALRRFLVQSPDLLPP